MATSTTSANSFSSFNAASKALSENCFDESAYFRILLNKDCDSEKYDRIAREWNGWSKKNPLLIFEPFPLENGIGHPNTTSYMFVSKKTKSNITKIGEPLHYINFAEVNIMGETYVAVGNGDGLILYFSQESIKCYSHKYLGYKISELDISNDYISKMLVYGMNNSYLNYLTYEDKEYVGIYTLDGIYIGDVLEDGNIVVQCFFPRDINKVSSTSKWKEIERGLCKRSKKMFGEIIKRA